MNLAAWKGALDAVDDKKKVVWINDQRTVVCGLRERDRLLGHHHG